MTRDEAVQVMSIKERVAAGQGWLTDFADEDAGECRRCGRSLSGRQNWHDNRTDCFFCSPSCADEYVAGIE